MLEYDNGMCREGEWANSIGLVILAEGLDVFTLGSVAASERASFTTRLILFLLLATFGRHAERRDNPYKDSLFALAVPDSTMLQTATQVAKS
jgi:hypothetical protein